MNKKTLLYIVIGLVIALAAGFYGGIKYARPSVAEEFYVAQVDSLVRVNNELLDSLAQVRADTKVITKDIVKYKIRYDTIRISQNTNELLGNLKTIINTPIE